MDLSIIIVNWNSADYLIDCLASIRQTTKTVTYEIIIVDNASSQKELDKLAQCYKVTLIGSEHNLGFARANNLGYRRSSGKYLLFLNPDTQIINPAIDMMMAQIRNLRDAGIVGCKLLNTDLSLQLSSIQKFPTILNHILDAEYLQLRWPRFPLWGLAPLFSESRDAVKVDAISGACMLLRRDIFAQIGMFSEDYFMYAEDLDLNYKANRAGFSNYYVGGALIIHHGGKSSRRQKVNQWSTIMKQRAMQRYYRKTRGSFYERLYRLAIACVAACRIVILALAYPFGDMIWKKESRQPAMEKWVTILSWAIGLRSVSVDSQ